MKKAKAYLYRLKTLNDAIERSLLQLEKLREEMFCTSGMDYSKDRVQVSPQDRLSAAMAEYVDLDAKIICETGFSYNNWTQARPNFCINCGADMRGEEDA